EQLTYPAPPRLPLGGRGATSHRPDGRHRRRVDEPPGDVLRDALGVRPPPPHRQVGVDQLGALEDAELGIPRLPVAIAELNHSAARPGFENGPAQLGLVEVERTRPPETAADLDVKRHWPRCYVAVNTLALMRIDEILASTK